MKILTPTGARQLLFQMSPLSMKSSVVPMAQAVGSGLNKLFTGNVNVPQAATDVGYALRGMTNWNPMMGGMGVRQLIPEAGANEPTNPREQAIQDVSQGIYGGALLAPAMAGGAVGTGLKQFALQTLPKAAAYSAGIGSAIQMGKNVFSGKVPAPGRGTGMETLQGLTQGVPQAAAQSMQYGMKLMPLMQGVQMGVNAIANSVPALSELSDKTIQGFLPHTGSTVGQWMQAVGQVGLRNLVRATLIETPIESLVMGVANKMPKQDLIKSIEDQILPNLVYNLGYATMNTADQTVGPMIRDQVTQALTRLANPLPANVAPGQEGYLQGPSATTFGQYPEYVPTTEQAKPVARSIVSDKGAKLLPVANDGSETVADVLSHPKLYTDYPDIADIPVRFNPDTDASGTVMLGNTVDHIEIGTKVPGKIKENLLHEVNHVVQTQEGMSKGTNMIPGPADTEYRRWLNYAMSPGEVEARSTMEASKLPQGQIPGVDPYSLDPQNLGSVQANIPQVPGQQPLFPPAPTPLRSVPMNQGGAQVGEVKVPDLYGDQFSPAGESGLTAGQIQQTNQPKLLTDFENAWNAGDLKAAQAVVEQMKTDLATKDYVDTNQKLLDMRGNPMASTQAYIPPKYDPKTVDWVKNSLLRPTTMGQDLVSDFSAAGIGVQDANALVDLRLKARMGKITPDQALQGADQILGGVSAPWNPEAMATPTGMNILQPENQMAAYQPKTSIQANIPAEMGISAAHQGAPTIEEVQPFYETPQSQNLESSLKNTAVQFEGIRVNNVGRNPGVWKMTPEASLTVDVDAPSAEAMDAYAAYHGAVNGQEAVGYFAPNEAGPDLKWTINNISDMNEALARLGQEGIEGATTNGPHEVAIWDVGGVKSPQIDSFAKSLGATVTSTPGNVKIIGANDYENIYKGYQATHSNVPQVPENTWATFKSGANLGQPQTLTGNQSSTGGGLNESGIPVSSTIPTNGSVAANIPRPIVDTAYRATVKNGGVTISTVTGKQPSSGYAYSPYKGAESVTPKADFTPDSIDNYGDEHESQLLQKGNHLGIWEENGQIYMDISKVGPPTAKTIAEAEKNKQLAVFDLKNFETIYTKLSPQYAKTNSTDLNGGQIPQSSEVGGQESLQQIPQGGGEGGGQAIAANIPQPSLESVVGQTFKSSGISGREFTPVKVVGDEAIDAGGNRVKASGLLQSDWWKPVSQENVQANIPAPQLPVVRKPEMFSSGFVDDNGVMRQVPSGLSHDNFLPEWRQNPDWMRMVVDRTSPNGSALYIDLHTPSNSEGHYNGITPKFEFSDQRMATINKLSANGNRTIVLEPNYKDRPLVFGSENPSEEFNTQGGSNSFEKFKSWVLNNQAPSGESVQANIPQPKGAAGRGEVTDMIVRSVDPLGSLDETKDMPVKVIKNPTTNISTRLFKLNEDTFPLGGRVDNPWLSQNPGVRGMITSNGDTYYADGRLITHEEMMKNIMKMDPKANMSNTAAFLVSGNGDITLGDLGDAYRNDNAIKIITKYADKISKAVGFPVNRALDKPGSRNISPEVAASLAKAFGQLTGNNVQANIPSPQGVQYGIPQR